MSCPVVVRVVVSITAGVVRAVHVGTVGGPDVDSHVEADDEAHIVVVVAISSTDGEFSKRSGLVGEEVTRPVASPGVVGLARVEVYSTVDWGVSGGAGRVDGDTIATSVLEGDGASIGGGNGQNGEESELEHDDCSRY